MGEEQRQLKMAEGDVVEALAKRLTIMPKRPSMFPTDPYAVTEWIHQYEEYMKEIYGKDNEDDFNKICFEKAKTFLPRILHIHVGEWCYLQIF